METTNTTSLEEQVKYLADLRKRLEASRKRDAEIRAELESTLAWIDETLEAGMQKDE